MKKSDCKKGMLVTWQGETTHIGVVVKLKPIVAVMEVYDPETGDTEIHEVSYGRLKEGGFNENA